MFKGVPGWFGKECLLCQMSSGIAKRAKGLTALEQLCGLTLVSAENTYILSWTASGPLPEIKCTALDNLSHPLSCPRKCSGRPEGSRLAVLLLVSCQAQLKAGAGEDLLTQVAPPLHKYIYFFFMYKVLENESKHQAESLM